MDPCTSHLDQRRSLARWLDATDPWLGSSLHTTCTRSCRISDICLTTNVNETICRSNVRAMLLLAYRHDNFVFYGVLSVHTWSLDSVPSVALPLADKDNLPRLSHNEMDAMDVIQNEVDRFLEHSAYSFLDLGFLTSSFKS